MMEEETDETQGDDAIEMAESAVDDNEDTTSERPATKSQVRSGSPRTRTPEEEEYLKWLGTAPTIFKRNLDAETIASVGYDGAFEPIDAPGRQGQRGDPYVMGEDGKEKMLLRVVLVGGGDAEGIFLKRLSDQAAEKLVSGLYVLWDPRAGDLSEHFAGVPFLNVHELGSQNTKDPVKIAQHASFLCAHMVIVASKQAGTAEDYIARVKAAALKEGLTFVGPSVAAEVVDGNLETFTKLVEGTREAVAASYKQ